VKILLSGMTAQQSSQKLSAKNTTFAGMIASALSSSGIDVVWQDPQMVWTVKDVAEYDAVLLGVAPVLSLTASKSYGILSLIYNMYGSTKLTLFVDAPEPARIHASLRAVERNNDQLFKDLYSLRPGFRTANKKSVLRGADILLRKSWPKTIYPALPIDQSIFSSPGIPENMGSSFVGVNIDALSITNKTSIHSTKSNYWVADNLKTKWMSDVSRHLMYPARLAKQSKAWTDAQVEENIATSVGLLSGLADDKLLWWSPRIVQALNACVPVATEWRLASRIGNAWNHLAAGIEEMSIIDRHELAVTQRDQYLSTIPSMEKAVDLLVEEITA